MLKKGTDRGMRRWRAVAVLALGVAIGTAMMATPAWSHFQASISHLQSHFDPRYANAKAGTDKAKNADKVDGFDSSALRDGPSIVTGRTHNDGGVDCLTGSISGVTTTAACSVQGLIDRSGVFPTARVIRKARADIQAPIGNLLRFFVISPDFTIQSSCDIPAGQTTCTIAGPINVPAGKPVSIEVDGTPAASVGYGMEVWSTTAGAAGVPARSAISPQTSRR
jgi:hypothetical protein